VGATAQESLLLSWNDACLPVVCRCKGFGHNFSDSAEARQSLVNFSRPHTNQEDSVDEC
jgi:hypothetical protein